jgi:hypothetical protein
MFSRQLFRTHRPFRAIVMDAQGSPVLWVSNRSLRYALTMTVMSAQAPVRMDQFSHVRPTPEGPPRTYSFRSAHF